MTSCNNNKLNFYGTSWPRGGVGPLDGGRWRPLFGEGAMPGAEAFLSLSARATHLQLRSGDWQGSVS